MKDHTGFISHLSILHVWHALGGGDVRYKRGRAFWRAGDGWSISLDTDKGCWYDHVAAAGGGILDLVQTALGCDRARAVAWLREFAGLPADELTQQERHEFARRRAAARAEANE